MKLCGIFCFVLSLNLSANVYSQQNKVSLDLKEVTLEEFIEAVKQQTGVNFLYNASLFEGGERQGKERALVQGAGRNAGTKRLCY